MDILGIGPLELVLILIIALIVLGPKDMVKTGRSIGKFLRQIVTSPTWRTVTRTSNELRNLPNRLIREAGLEEQAQELQNLTKNANLKQWQQDVSAWVTPPADSEQPTAGSGIPPVIRPPESKTPESPQAPVTDDSIPTSDSTQDSPPITSPDDVPPEEGDLK
jgi:sec-independent protein translocase protein TatB